MIGGDAIAKTRFSNPIDDLKENCCAIILQYRPVFLRENGWLVVVPMAVVMTLVATLHMRLLEVWEDGELSVGALFLGRCLFLGRWARRRWRVLGMRLTGRMR